MMREYLFRGKRKDNGKWVHGWVTTQHKKYTGGDLLTKIQSSTFGVGEHYVDTETIGQYTGLKDKNGKKIFEGDIIDFPDCSDSYYSSGHGVVQYDSDETEFAIIYDSIYKGLGRCHYSRDIEVIGNIYDHPDLLKRGNNE